MFCTNCGKQIGDGAAFCPECGKPQAQVPTGQNPYFNVNRRIPETVPTSKVIGETFSFMVKLFLLCALAAIVIAAIIGVIVWRVDYSDGPKPFNGAKIKAQTIWETDGLKVDAKKLVDPDIGLNYMVLKVKNGSGRDLTIKAVSLAVNGVSVPAYLEQSVANGETEALNLEMDDYNARYLGVDTPSEFTIELQALDTSSGSEVLRSGVLSVKTSITEAVQTPSYTGYFDKHSDLFTSDGINIGSFGYLVDPIGPGFTVENTTNGSVRVDFTMTEISGREVIPRDDFYYKSAVIQPGTKGPCFVHSNFEELRQMDGDGNGEVFPVRRLSGKCAIYDAYDGTLISERSFEYSEE